MNTPVVKGWGLSTRPAASDVAPNTIFTDLNTSISYVVEDGEWHKIPYFGEQEVPDYTVAMQGKVLTVDNTGHLAWMTPTHPAFPKADNQPDSEATTIATLKTDFNTLLASLKAAGLMAADPEATE